MSAKTLLQMAGASPVPATLASAALVVIDAQQEYTTGKLPLAGVDAALEEIARLLARARKAGTPVIHIKHRGRAGGLFDPATNSFVISPRAAPAAGETVIEKGLPNAFAGTTLKEALDATGRKELILTGFATHMCVEATARAAVDLGLKPTVVAAATATRDLPEALGGGTLNAAEVKRNALAALADRFATVVADQAGIAD